MSNTSTEPMGRRSAAYGGLPSRIRLKRRRHWSRLWQLTKPRIVLLITFCAVIGMLLALPAWPDPGQWRRIGVASAGIWLVASAAAALNCLLEKNIDARMQRTRQRSTATGDLRNWQVLLLIVTLGAAGTTLLWRWIGAPAACLTLAGFVGYGLVYTVILKPLTSQNIVLGGVAGALPPVIGWVAMTGEASAEAWLLFLIILVWTPPHFWALAQYRMDEYARAGLPMLPVVKGRAYTSRAILAYTIALLVVCVLPVILGMRSWLYLCTAVTLSAVFCGHAWRLTVRYSDRLALKTFRWSLWHLAGTFAALLADHYLL